VKKIPPAPDVRFEAENILRFSERDYDLAKKFNEKYYHWEDLRYRTESKAERERVWSLMKLCRGLSLKQLNIGGIECSFSMTSDIVDLILDLETRLSRLIDYQTGELTIETMRYSVSSFIDESIMSSIIEGAGVTREEAKKMIRKGEHPKTIGGRMVMNNYLAMENIKTTKNEKMSPELIKQMHRVITEGTLEDGDEWAGRFRESNDIVVGDSFDEELVFHVPPPFDAVKNMMDGLCAFCNDEDDRIHPIIKSIILHFAIGHIHPFIDGNGRLARSLFYWYLVKKGYRAMEYVSISTIIRSSIGKYGMAYQYTESDGNDLTYFLNYNLECLRRAVEELEKYIQNKITEQKTAIALLGRDSKLNLRQALILNDHLDGISTFTLSEIKNKHGCAYQTARTDVLALESMGLVRAAVKDGKKVLYVVDPEKVREYASQ
jgi:Fic family protein